MAKILIKLSNNTDSYNLIFDLFDTGIADKWSKEILKSYPLFENNRFTCWPNSEWTLAKYADKLNECIDIIKSVYPTELTAKELMTPDETNELHKLFEIVRGGVDSPSLYFTNSSDQVKTAIIEYNVYIHDYEKLAYSPLKSPTITCTFSGQRLELADEDYDHFTYNWKFGHMYINYCEVGKHLLEMFIDKDDVVGLENIRPLKYYSADFKIKFSPDMPVDEYNNFTSVFEEWFDSKTELFATIGIHKDKYRALGLIPVAVINRQLSGFNNYSEQDIINCLAKYNKVESASML